MTAPAEHGPRVGDLVRTEVAGYVVEMEDRLYEGQQQSGLVIALDSGGTVWRRSDDVVKLPRLT
ncbi:hypothetical protein [Pseudonocardia broussonetiae]|uniref:Uncharacterized protein n=1 Tax=Pseudonocardia broussonetiae TaxID=2736640 RepID=A0A6M6JVG3_9PSEU|nr:hypothetical protein [Pseudonocardia broussonetiae]QJY51233.1 hypothetical protein HOP40_35215 [Pseudonocardia broussonetiae]